MVALQPTLSRGTDAGCLKTSSAETFVRRSVTVGGTAINFITAPTASSAVSILAASGCRRYLLAAFPHFKPLQRYNRCAARVTRTFPERYMASV
jgi:hypothetical protein